jgi:hypothetical protein
MIPINRTPRKNIQGKLGSALLITGIILFSIFRFGNAGKLVNNDDIVIVVSFIGTILIIIGGFLLYRSRQYKAKALTDKILNEGKPYVLYLRPFKLDSNTRRFIFSQFYFGNTRTMEEQLLEVLKPFGDLLSIGKPEEALPQPGAAKIYASNNWREVVVSKMNESKLVVILAGTGEGIIWELKEAFEILNPKKLLILVPTMSKKSYESFYQEAAKKFKVILPKTEEIKRFVGGVSPGFIRFSADWKSSFLPLKSTFLRKNPYTPYLSRFTFALQPVFKDFGLEWHKPRYSKLVLFALGLILSLLLFIIVILILAQLYSDEKPF